MESLQAGTNIQAQHLRRDQGWQNKWSSLLATKENSACVYLVTLTTQQRLQFLSTSTALEVKGLKERREKGPCEWISCQLLAHQVVLGFGHIWIIWAQPGLVDLQGTTVVIFHLLIFALILTQQGQVVQLFGHIWVVLPQDLMDIRKVYVQVVFLPQCISPFYSSKSCCCFHQAARQPAAGTQEI